LLNYFNKGNGQWDPGDLYAVLNNCVVYGSLDSEVICDSLPGAPAYLKMRHCLLKMGTIREPFAQFEDCIFNKDPLFKDPNREDFHLQSGSPAAIPGVFVNGLGADLDGITWPNPPNLGCYKSQ
jgi:hypothetical protein